MRHKVSYTYHVVNYNNYFLFRVRQSEYFLQKRVETIGRFFGKNAHHHNRIILGLQLNEFK